MEGAATQQQLLDLRNSTSFEIEAVKELYEARIQEVAADVSARQIQSSEARIQEIATDVHQRQAEKFKAVEDAFHAEQKRLANVFAECETNWKAEQSRMNELLSNMQQTVTTASASVSAMADGKLSEVIKKISEQDTREHDRVQFLNGFVQTSTDTTSRAMGELTADIAQA